MDFLRALSAGTLFLDPSLLDIRLAGALVRDFSMAGTLIRELQPG